MTRDHSRPESLEAWLKLLETRHPKPIDLGLDRVLEAAERLNLLPVSVPVISVAGTNGKGSVVACTEALALAHNLSVATFTSPHILRFNERIKINGKPVSDSDLFATFNDIEDQVADVSLTYFEFTFIAALLLFKQQRLDLMVLEVGLGGRLDATNIVDADVAVITSIAFDHMRLLGDTLEKIAFEKAGIARAGKPCVVASAEAYQHLETPLAAIGPRLLLAGDDYQFTESEPHLRIRLPETDTSIEVTRPHLISSNAAAALVAFQEAFPLQFDAEHCSDAMAKVKHIGRFEVVSEAPEIIIDVAHNPASIQALASKLAQRPCSGNSYALCGMLSDKAIADSLATIADEFEHWLCVDLAPPRGASAQQVQTEIKSLVPTASTECFQAMGEAIAAARQRLEERDRLIVFGSFVTVADFLREGMEQSG